MRPPPPWSLVDVDLVDPPRSLEPPAGAGAVWAITRYKGAVVGHTRFLASELPMTASELSRAASQAAAPAVIGWLTNGSGHYLAPQPGRRRVRPRRLEPALCSGDMLARLDALLAERRARPVPHEASIVICTRRRAQALRTCLASIKAETAAGREVIVVDNGPDAETEAVARSVPGVRYVAEPAGGLSRARNTGVAAAAGEVVAFIDDDVLPEPGWLDALLPAFTDDRVAVACGLVLPAALDTDAQITFEQQLGFGGMGFVPLRFDAEFVAGARRGVPAWEIGAGANMAVRRSTVLQLGGFDERIGPGAAGGCGDDSEFWHRVLLAGAEARYEPLSVVRHVHREDWASLRRQAHGYGLGHVVALFAQYAHDGDRGDLVRAFWTLPCFYLRRLLRAPGRAAAGRPDRLLPHELAGYLSGLRHANLAFAPNPRALNPARATIHAE